MHGGDIYSAKIKYDFSVSINPFSSNLFLFIKWIKSFYSLRNYPDLKSLELKNALSKNYKIDAENILIGNGASELILTAVSALMPEKALLISPSFSGYENALNSIGSSIEYFPLDEKDDFNFTSEKTEQLINFVKTINPDIVFFCNPNNPNGKLYSKELILKILSTCKKSGSILLLDECFMDLTGKTKDFSLIEKLKTCDNLLIINALTKTFAVPGLRLGFCFCGSKNIASKIQTQLPEWNVSSPAQKIGVELIKEFNKIPSVAKKILKERNFLLRKLNAMNFKTYPSDSNFILFYCNSEINLKEKLLKKQILIRDCSDYKNLTKGFYRIAVKSHKENKKLLSSIREVMGEN